MKISFENLKAPIKFVKKLRFEPGADPGADWRIFFWLAVSLAAILLFFSIYNFQSMAKSGAMQASEDLSSQRLNVFDLNTLNLVIRHLDSDTKELEILATTPTKIVDPSI